MDSSSAHCPVCHTDRGRPPDLTRLIYELLDAHDDTLQLASDLATDPRWDAHLGYLRDLHRLGRRAVAAAELERHAFLYEACEVPPGMTLPEFRALLAAARS